MRNGLVLAAALIAASTGAASAATIFSDDFESYAQGAPGSIAPTWTVLEGSVDVIGTPGDFPWYPGQQIDMNGSGGDSTAATIFTVLNGLIAGHKYSLSFDYGSNKNSNGEETLLYGVFGSFADLLGAVYTSGPVPNLLSSGKLLFTASSDSVLLAFADGQSGFPYDDDNDQGGPVLDNVNVSSVPLPAGGLLLLAGLGGLACLRRRKTV